MESCWGSSKFSTGNLSLPKRNLPLSLIKNPYSIELVNWIRSQDKFLKSGLRNSQMKRASWLETQVFNSLKKLLKIKLPLAMIPVLTSSSKALIKIKMEDSKEKNSWNSTKMPQLLGQKLCGPTSIPMAIIMIWDLTISNHTMMMMNKKLRTLSYCQGTSCLPVGNGLRCSLI